MPELLIVGGLTVDRFADGRRAPGGSVLHAGVAAAAEGTRPAFVAVAGPEPEAQHGLARLRELGDVTHQPTSRTTAYRHDESGARRVLVLEALSEPIRFGGGASPPPADIALLAPIADELPAEAIAALRASVRPRLTVCLIQGWLRRLRVGEQVAPLSLAAVPESLWRAFGAADAVVVSTEDLADGAGDAFGQASALRGRLGGRPLLVLTLGVDGYILDDPGADRIVASVPRTVVSGVPTVGAGDTFGATLALRLLRGAAPADAAAAASDRVIAVLESRR